MRFKFTHLNVGHKRAAAVFLFMLLFSAASLSAAGVEARNIKLNILIEKAGFEEGSFTRTTTAERTQQSIVTLEGHEAVIFVGRRVPQIIAIRNYLIDQQYLDYAIQFAAVGTQLRVLPRLLGNVVEVEVTPEISYQTQQDTETHVIQVNRLSTTVQVPVGETIQLGSVVSDSEFFDAFYRNERGERLVIYLTPQVLD